MTVIGTQIDSDKRLLKFRNYEEYLDSLVSPLDICYLRSGKTARQLAELGYRSTGETLSEESFARRSRIVRHLVLPLHRPYELASEHVVTPASRVMRELALRERPNRLGVLSTVVFVRRFVTRLRFEESAYIDFADRLGTEDWLPYFRDERKLKPLKSDLAYYNWKTGRTWLNGTRNYAPIVDPERGLLLKNVHDRQLIAVDPAASPGVQTTRLRVRCPVYGNAVLYDHVVRSKILQEV